MDKLQISEIERKIVSDILEKYLPNCEVWAFGSRAKGTANPYSDLDLAIISNTELPLELMADLKEEFSNSDLIYKIDILDWNNTSEYFQEIIKQEKIVFKY